MADRFFDNKANREAKALFASQFAEQWEPALQLFLLTAATRIFPRVVQPVVAELLERAAYTVPKEVFPWIMSTRTTHHIDFTRGIGAAFWEDIVVAERLQILWQLRDYTPSAPHETDVFAVYRSPWGDHREPILRGVEGTDTNLRALSSVRGMNRDTYMDTEVETRVEENHSVRAIIQRLARENPEYDAHRRQRLWATLWTRDVFDRSVHPVYDEKFRFPAIAAEFYADLLNKHAAHFMVVDHQADTTDTHEAAYRTAMDRAAEGMAGVIISVARLLSGRREITHPELGLPRRPQVVTSTKIGTEDHAEVWLMLGRYPIALFRSSVMRREYDNESSELIQALRLVRYALAPRIWPKGDQIDYQTRFADAHEHLRALQRSVPDDTTAEWDALQHEFFELCLGLLYADPSSCVHVKIFNKCWRTPLLSTYAFRPLPDLVSVPTDVYNVNTIEERRRWAERTLVDMDPQSTKLYDYESYDADLRERMIAEDTEREFRLLQPPQQAQEIQSLEPTPSSSQSDDEIQRVFAHARHSVERSHRGMGLNGGTEDRSLFVVNAEVWAPTEDRMMTDD